MRRKACRTTSKLRMAACITGVLMRAAVFPHPHRRRLRRLHDLLGRRRSRKTTRRMTRATPYAHQNPFEQHARFREGSSLSGVTFKELWDNFPSGKPYDNPAYTNQCAIRMSVTLHRVGVGMKSFNSKTVKPVSGAKTIGRIMLDDKPTATRAEEMGNGYSFSPSPVFPEQRTSLGRTGSRRSRDAPVSYSSPGTGRAAANRARMRVVVT